MADLQNMLSGLITGSQCKSKEKKRPTRYSATFTDGPLPSSTRYSTHFKNKSRGNENQSSSEQESDEEESTPTKHTYKPKSPSKSPKKTSTPKKQERGNSEGIPRGPPSPPSSDDPSSSDEEEDRKRKNRDERDREERERERRRRKRRDSHEGYRTRSGRSSFFNESQSIASKSIQKLHEKTLRHDKYLGPEDDKYAPLEYIRVFEQHIASKCDSDEITGDIFYSAISQSEWCRGWNKLIDKGDGYKKMREMFIKHEWDVSIQNYFYNTFMQTNRKEPQHANYKEFYIYWKQRLEGINVGDEHLLHQFQAMLPPRAAAKLDLQEVTTLRKFHKFVYSLDDRELEWYDSKIVNSFERRKALMLKQKEGRKNTNTGKSSYTQVPINQISSTIETDEKDDSQQDF